MLCFSLPESACGTSLLDSCLCFILPECFCATSFPDSCLCCVSFYLSVFVVPVFLTAVCVAFQFT